MAIFIHQISHGRNIEKNTAKRYVHKNIWKTYKDHNLRVSDHYYIFVTIKIRYKRSIRKIFKIIALPQPLADFHLAPFLICLLEICKIV